MDVRAKQRLSFGVVRQTQTGLVAVSPHVISAVRQLLVNCENTLMKKLKTLFLFGVVLLTANSSFAQTAQPSPSPDKEQTSKRTFKHNQNVEEKYDKFKDKTSVTLKLRLLGDITNGLEVVLTETFAGQKPVTPTNFPVMFMATNKDLKYYLSHGLIFLVDGERIKFDDVKYTKLTYQGYFIEVMILAVPFNTLKKIVAAKKVEAQLGSTEFALSDDYLEAMRDFVSRVSP